MHFDCNDINLDRKKRAQPPPRFSLPHSTYFNRGIRPILLEVDSYSLTLPRRDSDFQRWRPKCQTASRGLTVKAHQDKNVVGSLAHIYLVNQLETKDSSWKSHVGLASAEARNDDSDEGKDEDGGNIEAEAPGGWLAI